MLTYGGQVSPTLIPSRHNNEASEDATLHRLHVSCATFRGKDVAGLLQLFRYNLSKAYESILALDTSHDFQVLADFYSALNEAVEVAGAQATVELNATDRLYLFEFSKITKTGGGSTTPSYPWNGQGFRYTRP